MLARSGENRAAELGPSVHDWWQDWRGECAALIASGPSAKKANIEALRDRIHVAVVNEAHRLCPWADVLYGCDFGWWKLRSGVPEFAGLKLAQDQNACKKYSVHKINIEKAGGNDLLLQQPGDVGAGGNSGFQLFNIVVQFGATGIILIGFDMQGEHWHGRHPQPLSNPDESNFARWRKAFDGASGKLRDLGVDVINCSQESRLRAYPKMTVEAALARWGL